MCFAFCCLLKQFTSAGHSFQEKHALTIAQLVGSLLLLLSEQSQLDTVDIDKVSFQTHGAGYYYAVLLFMSMYRSRASLAHLTSNPARRHESILKVVHA